MSVSEPRPLHRPPDQRGPGRPPKTPDRTSARDALLDAAHALMSERGSLDIPVADIAGRAGLNVALVSYHFGGKEALYVALTLRHQGEHAAALLKLTRLDAPAEVKLRLHIRAMVREFRRIPYLQRLNHKILRDSGPDMAQASAIAQVRPLADFYRALVVQGVAEGVFRAVDPMHLYFTIGGACDFLFAGGASLKHGFGVETVSDDLADAYVDHLSQILSRGLLVPA